MNLEDFHYFVNAYFRMLNFWSSDNCILQSCYNELVLNSTKFVNWATCIRNLSFNLGMNDLWDNRWLFELDKSFLQVIKQRLYDQTKQDLHRIFDDSSKCRLYKYVVCNVELYKYVVYNVELYKYVVYNVELQFYLQKSIHVMLSRCIIKIRLSSHNLCIETEQMYN